MNKTLIIIAALCLSSGCLRNVKYESNPVQGKSFIVSFQEENVTAIMNSEASKAVAYRGACTITSKSEKVLTIIDLRNTNVVENIKTSINDGVVLAPSQTTYVPKCFVQPVDGQSAFQIIYKDGERLLTDELPVAIQK